MYLENTLNHQNTYKITEYSDIYLDVASSVYPDNKYSGFTKEKISIYSKDTDHCVVMVLYHNYRIYKVDTTYVIRISTDNGRNRISTNYSWEEGFGSLFKAIFKIYNQYDYRNFYNDSFEEAIVDIDSYTNRYFNSFVMDLCKHFFVLTEFLMNIRNYFAVYADVQDSVIRAKLRNQENSDVEMILYLPIINLETRQVDNKYSISVKRYSKNKFNEKGDDIFIENHNNTDIFVLLRKVKCDEDRILRIVEAI